MTCRRLCIAAIFFVAPLFCACSSGDDDPKSDGKNDQHANDDDDVTTGDDDESSPQDDDQSAVDDDSSQAQDDDSTPPDDDDDETGDDDDDGYPDHTFIHEAVSDKEPVEDTPYDEYRATFYGEDDGLPLPVNLIATTIAGTDLESFVLVGTPEGLFSKKQTDADFTPLFAEEISGNVEDLYITYGEHRVSLLVDGKPALIDLSAETVEVFEIAATPQAVANVGNTLFVATNDGLGTVKEGVFSMLPGTEGLHIIDLCALSRAYAITEDTVLLIDDENGVLQSWNSDNADFELQGLQAIAGGTVEIAWGTVEPYLVISANNALIEFLPGSDSWEKIEPTTDISLYDRALPAVDLTALAVLSANPISTHLVAVGHQRGATLFNSSPSPEHNERAKHYFVSRRYLPDDKVNDVAVEYNNVVWAATDKGLARIEPVTSQFAEKAEYLHELLDTHSWRMDGFVNSRVSVDNPVDLNVTASWDNDNDGLWTQMQVAAWCFAYAATGEEKYYDAAHKATQVMMMQIDLPAIDFEAAGLERGFVTRSLVRDDEGDVFTSKATLDNWHLVEYEGRQYYWKDDTSSDETTGHFLGYPLYYDLCAKSEQEKAEIAEHAGALASYIIDGGFKLLDLDGEPTTWGHWAPDDIGIVAKPLSRCIPRGGDIVGCAVRECANDGHNALACTNAIYGDSWLNAVEILGHLLAAWHMTGDPKFYDAYEKLVREERYEALVQFIPERVVVFTSQQLANYSDHELAFLAFYTLIRYEPNDERRRKWIDSMMAAYSYIEDTRNPLWTAVVASAVSDGYDLEAAVRTLREMPRDTIDYPVDNSHRLDARHLSSQRDGDVFDRVFPYDELRTAWWNSNPHEVSTGGDNKAMRSPMLWLLPYWMLRYYGLIE